MTDTGPILKPPQRSGTLILAAADVLDFFTIFIVGGFAIARLTGNVTPEGVELYGWSGWLHTAVVVAYFWLGRCYLGGTIWTRILRIR